MPIRQNNGTMRTVRRYGWFYGLRGLFQDNWKNEVTSVLNHSVHLGRIEQFRHICMTRKQGKLKPEMYK